GLLQEIAGRRRLHHESEGAVGIGGNDDRNRRPLFHLLRRRVELLAELHDVEAALTQRRADRRRRIRLAGRDLELDVALDLLRHVSNLSPSLGSRPLRYGTPAAWVGLPARWVARY